MNRVGEGRGESKKEVKRYKLPIIRYRSTRDIMYNRMTIVNVV